MSAVPPPRVGSPDPRAGQPAPTPWPQLLDALEERLRRIEAVSRGTEAGPVPDVALNADGPLPDSLRLRALALLDATRLAEDELARRLEANRRARTYQQD